MKNMMEKLRQSTSSTSLQLVSAPYLSSRLIWAALLLAYTDLMLILLGQPAGYWIDRSRAASNFPLLERVLAAGILSYALVGVLYLVLFWILLTVLTRSLALVVWMPFSFLHLTHILSWSIEKGQLLGILPASSAWPMLFNTTGVLILGIILARGLLRSGQTTPNTPHGKVWIKLVASSTWVILLIAVVSASAIWPRGGWAPLHTDHTPGRRGNAAVVYDPIRKKVILFGGVSDWLGNGFQHENDTWEWDGKDWIKMKTNTVPPARAGHMMAYDEKRGVVVMFGGEEQTGTYMLNDTWEWDGKDWKQIFPDNFPQGRRGGQMFYDHESGKIILLGGFYYAAPDKVFTHLNDAWEWDGKIWQYLTTMPKSLLINNPNVVYDPQRQTTTLFDYFDSSRHSFILYGGMSSYALDDMWEYVLP